MSNRFPAVRLDHRVVGNNEFIINMINNDTSQHEASASITYNETRTIPFLAKPNDYFLSVASFALDTSTSLPVWCPSVQLGQNDINKTVYEFRVEYNGQSVTQYIQYIPEDLTAQLPVVPIEKQDITSNYYYINSYQWIMYLFNNALSTAIDNLNALITLPSTAYPYFEFNVNTSLMTFNAPAQYYNSYISQPINVYVNNALSSLISTIMVNKIRILGQKWHRLMILSAFETKVINSTTYAISKQESTSIGLFNPVRAIVFGSSLLPINPAQTTPALIFSSNATIQNTGNNSSSTNTITEFSVPMANGNTYKNTVNYLPYVWKTIDLFGSQPLNQIQLSCLWKDRWGNLYPIQLVSGGCVNISLVFRRRDFYNLNLE